PLARDAHAVSQMPPHIATQPLRAARDFPRAEHLQACVIEPEHPSRAMPVTRPQGAHIDPFRATPDDIRMGIAGAMHNLLGGDNLDKVWRTGMQLRIDNIEP